MEDFYELMMNQKWGDILSKAKSDQVNLRKNKIEWSNICKILQGEFIKYAKNEKPVLVSTLCFKYIKLNLGGYIELTDESTLAIENLGIKAFEAQESLEIKSFAKICKFSPHAKEVIDTKPKPIKPSDPVNTKKRSFPRTDWLNPLFKSSSESHFYQALKEVFPTFFIYPNVALSNIFSKESIFPSLSSEQRDFYFKGVVDFVVYDPTDGHMPKFFFEVDSFYHDRHDAIIRDEKKNGIFNAANIQLYRIRPSLDSLTTKHDFVSEINRLLRVGSI